MEKRLSAATLAGHRAPSSTVILPPPRWERQELGILHLGIGAFHRAHQAVYAQEAFAATGDESWGISGVTQRSDDVRRQLGPQDGLYGVLEGAGAAEAERVTIVGAVREVLYPAEQQALLDERFGSPGVRIVSLTVTEKGYRRTGTGELNLSDPAVVGDLDGQLPSTAIGRLVRGLRHRAESGAGPITVLSCDNLATNGKALEKLVAHFCAESGQDDLSRWIADHVAFPSSMVDRIVPATGDQDRARAESIVGLSDRGLVVAETFRQWVIEDRFVAERPAWDLAGAQIVSDVTPFERMKLWILNGTHSAVAYLGALRGHLTIAEAMRDPEIRRFAADLIAVDVIPVTLPPDGQNLEAYGQSVLERLANPALAHTTAQVAMDGSQKIPLRLLGPLRVNLESGKMPLRLIRGVAAWMAYLVVGVRGDDGILVADPLADTVTSALDGRISAGSAVDALLGLPEVFGSDLPERSDVRDALVELVDVELSEFRRRHHL